MATMATAHAALRDTTTAHDTCSRASDVGLTSLDPVEIRSAAGRKLALHFGVPGRPLLGFYHPRAEGAPGRAAGVVLCSPIGTDHTRPDWTYRHLAERLAAAGFPCLRFDLSGTGDSAGDELGAGTVRNWVEDIGAAVEE